MRRLLSIVAPALALVLVGCGGGVLVYDSMGGRGSYDARDFDYAHRTGAVHAVIVGNPFGGDRGRFEARVLTLMQGQNRGLPATFVAAAGPHTDPLYKTVVAFDPPRNASADDLCRNPDGLGSRLRGGEVRVTMVFCEGDRAKSSATGVGRNVGGLGDPKFARLIRETTFFMVPDDAFIEFRQNSGQ